MRASPDRECAILAANILENSLAVAIARRLRGLSTADHNLIFKGESSVLGRFHAKIQMGYALNIYGKTEYDEMMVIKNVRNTFAHDLHVSSFNDRDVKKECRKFLGAEYMRWTEFEIDAGGDDPMEQVTTPRDQFVWAVVNMEVHCGIWAARSKRPRKEAWFRFSDPSFRTWLERHAPQLLPRIQNRD